MRRYTQYFHTAGQELGPKTALVLGYFWGWQNCGLHCWANDETIANELGLTEEEVRKAIARLTVKRLVRSEQDPSNDDLLGYALTEEALTRFVGVVPDPVNRQTTYYFETQGALMVTK